MSGTVLGLFRHGQTDWNIELRLQGTAEIPLNSHGVQQVRTATKNLDLSYWDIVLTSPLGRAKETADIILAEMTGTELLVEPMLIERSFGIGEGMLYSEWHEKYGQQEEIPGAESNNSITLRSRQLLDLMLEKYSGAKILAISHGALIRYLLNEVSKGAVPPAGERLQNASLHMLRHNSSWELDAWAPEPLGDFTQAN
jgi:broad specificity phosphatase PhoE